MRKIFLLLTVIVIALNGRAQFANEFINYSTTNTPAFTGNNFKTIWVGKGSQIWAGTQYQGLYKFDTVTKAWSKSAQLTNVFINDIKSDKNGGIWIAQSGTTGLSGSGSNTSGGINYFPDASDGTMIYYSTALTSGGFVSRNSRSIYIDTIRPNAATLLPRVWAAFATFTTSSATGAGGIGLGINASAAYFRRIYQGLQVFPNTNSVSTGTPSCYPVGGDQNEIWVGAEQNYVAGPTSQILRYEAATGKFLGGYDNLGAFDKTIMYYKDQARNYTDTLGPKGILPAGFRSTAIHFDAENRQWIGFRSGGLVVKQGSSWKSVNMPTIFPAGTTVNFNAITSDEYGYVYIGTSSGLVVFDGGGAVDNPNNYKRYTTTEGLPSNNITGICYDKFRGQVLLTSDAGVTFWKVKYKIDISMQWDYSFPERKGQPIGVAADGVARIYLKVKKISDTLPDIKEVNIKMANWTAAEANVRGKLKKALVIDRYSEEANDGTVTELTTTNLDFKPGKAGEFWFWYVAPEDFSNDSLSTFSDLTDRYDSVQVIATYLNNKKDTVTYKIRVVRPPLILQHGYNGAPNVWDNFSYNGIKFKDSYHFTYKHTPSMDPAGSAKKNAIQLLGADNALFGADILNTLQGNINEIRRMRFASNQVDYVCHSMGGVYIRAAIGWYEKKFFAGERYLYKNYQKGFTNKIITINTPHNGSPIPDLGYLLLSNNNLPDWLHQLLFRLYKHNIFGLKDGSLGNSIKPIDENNDYFSRMSLTDATTNLQVTDKNGGVNMPLTKAKNHLIAGDIDGLLSVLPGGITVFNVNFQVYDEALSAFYSILMEMQYAALCDPETGSPALAQDFKDKVLSKPHDVRIFTWFDAFSKSKGYANFFGDGDMIVPLKSELAGQSAPLPNVTVFKNSSLNSLDAEHSSVIRKRPDIGKYVFNLLNTKKSSPLFGDEIKANTDPDYFDIPTLGRPAQKPVTPGKVLATFYDTSKIRIDFPLAGSNLNTDSLLSIRFRLKDTANLAYVSIRFQFADSLNTIKTKTQQTVTVRLDPDIISKDIITAVAVYNKTGGGLDYHIDTVAVAISHQGTLQDFRVNEQLIQVTGGRPYYPQLQVKYNNQWSTLPNDAPGINVTVDSVNIVTYNAANHSLDGISEGATLANFSYNGLVDTVSVISAMPLFSNCINRTIAGGSYKNPAIWSKGMVPGICDSVIISAGHNVTADTSLQVRSLRISAGATLGISNAAYTLQLGEANGGEAMLDNYGTLNIFNGAINVQGRLKFNAASTFNMTGGKLSIDGNTGFKETGVPDGQFLFEAAPAMTSFSFTGGTLEIVDPPYGAASQAISCAYNFGANSILSLGNGISTTAGGTENGFGGNLFPATIGKLIINGNTTTGNRQFINVKALSVKGSCDVRAGSGLVIKAPLNVTQ